MFIVFEGLDGSGSTTQARLLSEYLENQGKKTVLTKEPTTRVIGSLIREYLQGKYTTSSKALQLLYASDRADHLSAVITPALQEKKIVISDRYFYSSIAFGSENEEDFLFLQTLYETFLKPDLIIFLRLDPKTCIERIIKRGQKRELFEHQEKLERVLTFYDRIFSQLQNVLIIDASEDLEKIAQKIQAIVIPSEAEESLRALRNTEHGTKGSFDSLSLAQDDDILVI
jgi:dTMP kinase